MCVRTQMLRPLYYGNDGSTIIIFFTDKIGAALFLR